MSLSDGLLPDLAVYSAMFAAQVIWLHLCWVLLSTVHGNRAGNPKFARRLFIGILMIEALVAILISTPVMGAAS